MQRATPNAKTPLNAQPAGEAKQSPHPETPDIKKLLLLQAKIARRHKQVAELEKQTSRQPIRLISTEVFNALNEAKKQLNALEESLDSEVKQSKNPQMLQALTVPRKALQVLRSTLNSTEAKFNGIQTLKPTMLHRREVTETIASMRNLRLAIQNIQKDIANNERKLLDIRLEHYFLADTQQSPYNQIYAAVDAELKQLDIRTKAALEKVHKAEIRNKDKEDWNKQLKEFAYQLRLAVLEGIAALQHGDFNHRLQQRKREHAQLHKKFINPGIEAQPIFAKEMAALKKNTDEITRIGQEQCDANQKRISDFISARKTATTQYAGLYARQKTFASTLPSDKPELIPADKRGANIKLAQKTK